MTNRATKEGGEGGEGTVIGRGVSFKCNLLMILIHIDFSDDE